MQGNDKEQRGPGDIGSADGRDLTQEEESFQYIVPPPRPSVLKSLTVKVPTGCGNMYVTCSFEGSRILEVFARHGKTGNCLNAQTDSLSRLLSVGLRAGIDPNQLLKHLHGTDCRQGVFHQGRVIKSCADAVAYAVESTTRLWYESNGYPLPEEEKKAGEALTEPQGADPSASVEEIVEMVPENMGGAPICPDCNAKLFPEASCWICHTPGCGYSKC